MPYGLNTGSSRGLPDLRLNTEHANAVGNYLGTYLLSCLSHNEEESAKVFCRLTDSFLRSFYVNEAEYPVDFLVVTKNDTAWIVIRGTENLMQGLGHLASIISTRNPTFGGWTNPQFDIQAKLLSDNLRANNLYRPSYTKYRIIGHSLGAATGYLLGLYIKHFRPECDVQCLGFGEPKSIAQFSSPDVDSHVRVIATTTQGIRRHFDPVAFCPPDAMNYAGLTKLLSVAGMVFRAGKWLISTTPEQHGQAEYIDENGNRLPDQLNAVHNWFRQLGLSAIDDATSLVSLHFLNNSYLPWTYKAFKDARNTIKQPEMFAITDRWLASSQSITQTNFERGNNMWNNWIKNQMWTWIQDFPQANWGATNNGVRFQEVQIFVQECVLAATSLNVPNDPTSLLALLEQRHRRTGSYGYLSPQQRQWVLEQAIYFGTVYRNREEYRQQAEQNAPANTGWQAGESEGSGGDWGGPEGTDLPPEAQSQMQSGTVPNAPIAPPTRIIVPPESVVDGTVDSNNITYLKPSVIRISPSRFGVFVEGREILAYDNKPAANRASQHAWIMIRQLALLNLSPEDFANALEGLVEDLESLSVNVATNA